MHDRRAAGTAALLECQECDAVWSDPRQRWYAYITDDEPPEAIFYCPDCNEREFGGDWSRLGWY